MVLSLLQSKPNRSSLGPLILGSLAFTVMLTGCDLRSLLQTDPRSKTDAATPSTPAPGPLPTVKIEDLNNGGGVDLSSLPLRVGDTMTFYAVHRDEDGDFVDNVAASWSLTGGVGTLTIAPDGKSATFAGTGAGAATIVLTSGALSSTYNLTVTALPTLVVSSTKTTSNASFSYVDLAVDWSRKLAYAASRKASTCIDTVDFTSTAAPVLVKTIGSGTLQVCLGAQLFDNNTKLLVSSNGSSKIAAWDLTSDPTAYASWASMGELAIGHNSKRFAGLVASGAGNWDVYLATRYNGRKISLSIAGAVATITNTATYAPGGLEFNDATMLGNRFLIQSFTGAIEPVYVRNLDMTANTSITTNFYNWTAETNAAGTKAYLAGSNGNAFFAYDGTNVTLTKKFVLSCMVRSSDFAIQGTREYLYSLCTNGRLDVFDVTSIYNPTLVRTGTFAGFEGEAYAIRVKPNSTTALVVTNRGDFIPLDLSGLAATTTQYSVDP